MSIPQPYLHKLKSVQEAAQAVASWRQQGEKVVFTNGVFDILHPGHVVYLAQARALGDKLVVGLNADVSAKLLNKGPTRPLQSEQARATVLCALESVSLIVLFSDPTPQALIQVLKPDVLVKGGDYEIEQIVGADFVKANGGEVKVIPFLPGFSTTSIEQKIVKIYNGG